MASEVTCFPLAICLSVEGCLATLNYLLFLSSQHEYIEQPPYLSRSHGRTGPRKHSWLTPPGAGRVGVTGGSWLPGMLPVLKPPSGSELGLGEQRAVRPQGQEPPYADTVGAHRRRRVKVTFSCPSVNSWVNLKSEQNPRDFHGRGYRI